MDVQNVKDLAESIKRGSPYTWQRVPEWREAFSEYNKDDTNPRKLSMSCRPCYYTVLAYLLIKNKILIA